MSLQHRGSSSTDSLTHDVTTTTFTTGTPHTLSTLHPSAPNPTSTGSLWDAINNSQSPETAARFMVNVQRSRTMRQARPIRTDNSTTSIEQAMVLPPNPQPTRTLSIAGEALRDILLDGNADIVGNLTGAGASLNTDETINACETTQPTLTISTTNNTFNHASASSHQAPSFLETMAMVDNTGNHNRSLNVYRPSILDNVMSRLGYNDQANLREAITGHSDLEEEANLDDDRRSQWSSECDEDLDSQTLSECDEDLDSQTSSECDEDLDSQTSSECDDDRRSQLLSELGDDRLLQLLSELDDARRSQASSEPDEDRLLQLPTSSSEDEEHGGFNDRDKLENPAAGPSSMGPGGQDQDQDQDENESRENSSPEPELDRRSREKGKGVDPPREQYTRSHDARDENRQASGSLEVGIGFDVKDYEFDSDIEEHAIDSGFEDYMFDADFEARISNNYFQDFTVDSDSEQFVTAPEEVDENDLPDIWGLQIEPSSSSESENSSLGADSILVDTTPDTINEPSNQLDRAAKNEQSKRRRCTASDFFGSGFRLASGLDTTRPSEKRRKVVSENEKAQQAEKRETEEAEGMAFADNEEAEEMFFVDNEASDEHSDDKNSDNDGEGFFRKDQPNLMIRDAQRRFKVQEVQRKLQRQVRQRSLSEITKLAAELLKARAPSP